MADNVTVPGTGTVFATNEIAGLPSVQWPYAVVAVDVAGVPTPNGAAAPLVVTGTVTTAGLTDAQLRAAAVPVSAAALPLPAGAATSAAQTTTNASLASLDAKAPALVSGAVPVAPATNATTTRAYTFASGQRIASVTASGRSTAITASEVMLHSSARCFVRVGDGTVVATAGAGSFPLEAGEKFHLRITSGQFVAVIRDTADGFLTVMPVA